MNVSSSKSRSQRDAIYRALETVFDQPDEHPTCPGCTGLKADIPDVELANLRVEFIKQQILKKLKLKEVPKVAPDKKLPTPVSHLTKTMNANSIPKHSEEHESVEDDDFYGKTNQVILFPEESSDCKDFKMADTSRPSACFTFHLPKDLDEFDIATSDFWVHKKKDFLDGDKNVNQTLVYLESQEADKRWGTFSVFERHITHIKDGWIKMDIARMVKDWLKYNQRRHTIQIICESCGYKPPWTPVSTEKTHFPILEIKTETKNKKRPKRNVNCLPGISECCREKLYISFVEIGWDDWILQPMGYEAYFCRGTCTNAASIPLSASAYTSVLQKYSRAKKKELIPCCTPTHMSSIQLFYYDDNQTITHKTLPNMVVESCGCM